MSEPNEITAAKIMAAASMASTFLTISTVEGMSMTGSDGKRIKTFDMQFALDLFYRAYQGVSQIVDQEEPGE